MTPTSTPTSGPQFTSRPRDDDRRPASRWRCGTGSRTCCSWPPCSGSSCGRRSPTTRSCPSRRRCNDTVSEKWWILALVGPRGHPPGPLPAGRTSWPAYHRFWTQKRVRPLRDRRAARYERLEPLPGGPGRQDPGLPGVLLSIVLGAIFDISPLMALFELPARIVDALPFVFQLAVRRSSSSSSSSSALFWFLSRGGVDVYYPDDIKTRFDDVWGQDNVLAGSGRTWSSSRTPRRSRRRAATSRAASCSGARPAPARR